MKLKSVPPGASPQALLKKDSESDLKNGAVGYRPRLSFLPSVRVSRSLIDFWNSLKVSYVSKLNLRGSKHFELTTVK